MEARTHPSTLEESAIIERVARIVFSVRGAKPDYTRLAAELEQAVPFDIFGVVLLRHDRQAVRVTVCQLEAGVWVAVHHQHPLGDSKLEQMLREPTLLVQDYAAGLDGPPALCGDALSGYHQLHSTLIAPLAIDDHVLGTLELGSTIPFIYAEANLQRLVSAVVRVLAAAIESVQLGGNAAIQDRQRQALKNVTSALTSKMDLSTILNQIVGGIADALKVASCIILFDRREGCLRVEAQSGLDLVALNKCFHRNSGLHEKCIIRQTLLSRQPFVSHDIATDEHFPASRVFFTELGMRSVFSYPLATGTRVYGALFLCSTEAGGFTPLKVDILALFANQATIAIHNGMLLESVHQRSRFQQAIEQLEQTQFHNSAPLQVQKDSQAELTLLERVRQETQQTFGVSFTSLLRFISDHLLTQDEKDLQAVFSPEQGNHPFSFADLQRIESIGYSADAKTLPIPTQKRQDPFAGTLALLAQTAEAALIRAGMLGELGRLLAQLKQSTNWVKDAWLIVDLDGVCIGMNPAAENLCDLSVGQPSTGYGEQLLATSLAQNISIKIEDIFAKLLFRVRNSWELKSYLQAFTQGSVYRRELRCTLAVEPLPAHRIAHESSGGRYRSSGTDSNDHYYQFIHYPLYNQQGQLEANALQVHDVTEQVRDEKNRSALLSAVSHDLRTPLTTIKAAVTGLLQTDVVWEEQDRLAMLEDIDCEADHLTVLVNALVELSRIEMGALILEQEWCDVVEVVYGALSKVTRVLAGRPVRTQFQSQLPLVYADHAQLERVFYNLIENAARHSPEQAEIVVILDTSGNAPELLRAQVMDHGPTIPEDEYERIFKSFYSLRSYGNVMGLAICRGIIEAHQGRIWVEAATTPGSCFVFTLPTHPHTAAHSGDASLSADIKNIPVGSETRGDAGSSFQLFHTNEQEE